MKNILMGIIKPKGVYAKLLVFVMLAIWKKFKKHKIEIPFPQRDLHLKTPDVLKVINDGQ